MKIHFVLFLLITGLFGFAQTKNYTITFANADTGSPIEGVTVISKKNKQTFISNSEGVVKISLATPTDLFITHFEHNTINVNSSTFKEAVFTIKLETLNTELSEIILTKEHPQEILKKLIENSSKKINNPAHLKVYSKEFFKLDGNYYFFNDGLLHFQILGNKNNLEIDLLVEQNRSFGVIEPRTPKFLLGYNLNDLVKNYYQFNYLKTLLSSSSKKNYDFVVKSYPANTTCYLIDITPTDLQKRNLETFKIVYDYSKKVIIEASSNLIESSVDQTKLVANKKYPFKSNFRNTYVFNNKEYYLANATEQIGFAISYKNQIKKVEINNQLIVTNFSSKKFPYAKSDIYNDKSLLRKSNLVLTDYWNGENGVLQTDEEKKIIENLLLLK